MASVGNQGGSSSSDTVGSGGIASPFSNHKIFLGLALGAAIILMLADFYPKVMIGFMLLILAGVMISHVSIVTDFMNGL